MDADCVRDARPVLEREGVPYRLTPSGDGFEIFREDRARAQVALVFPRQGDACLDVCPRGSRL